MLITCGCTRDAVIDTLMTSAYRPASGPVTLTPLAATEAGEHLLAGDLHCHVSPPDADWDVSRGVEETIALARAEHLDFVVLTPHVPGRFWMDPRALAFVREGQRELEQAISAANADDLVLVPGFEYTDHEYGHVGMAFAELDDALARVDAASLAAHPEQFVDAWVAAGGTIVVNHPLITPIDAPVAMARADLSWRPWSAPGETLPPEVARMSELAIGWEAYNLTASHLRDRYLLRDGDASIVATFAMLDREVARRRGRMTPTGGSDSHGNHLRATTFVLANGRSASALREGLVGGRVCVRSSEACALRVRAPGSRWVGVGEAIEGASEIELDVPEAMREATFYVHGRPVRPNGEVGTLRLDVRTDRCIPVRAVVGESFSAPVYVNCGLAPAGAGAS